MMVVGDTKRLKSEERREQLLDVASHLFSEGGYEGTTMDNVAKAAGVTKPLLYQHFESKHALYEEIITTAATKLLDALSVAASPEVAPRDKVDRAFHIYFSMMVSDDVSFRLLLAEPADEDISRHLDAIYNVLVEFLNPLIDAGLEPDHQRLLAATVVGAARASASYWLDNSHEHGDEPDQQVVDRLARRTAQFIWGGLRGISPD
jgi:AcrR family transcriptional regulator